MEGALVLIPAVILLLPLAIAIYYLIAALIHSEIKERRQKKTVT